MEPTLEQYLDHLFKMAMEASAPAKIHSLSQKAFDALKKAIEESAKQQKTELSSVK